MMSDAATALKISIITGTEIHKTGTVSYKFMFDSGAPDDQFIGYDNWGFIELKKKGDDHFNPWEWAKAQRGEEYGQIVGDDGVLRWNINVFNSKGFVMGCGADDAADDSSLRKLISDIPSPCVLLMHRALFDRFQKVCEELGVELVHHHYDGELATS